MALRKKRAAKPQTDLKRETETEHGKKTKNWLQRRIITQTTLTVFNINACTWFVKTWLTIIRKMDLVYIWSGVCVSSFTLPDFTLLMYLPFRVCNIKAGAKICQINIKTESVDYFINVWLFNGRNICWKYDLLTFTRYLSRSFNRSNSLWTTTGAVASTVVVVVVLFVVVVVVFAAAVLVITLNVHAAINSCNLVSNLNQHNIEACSMFFARWLFIGHLNVFAGGIHKFWKSVKWRFFSYRSFFLSSFECVCVCFYAHIRFGGQILSQLHTVYV